MTAAAASSVQGEAALAAFLRGIERRGLVLAEAQCGDPVRAQVALVATMAVFRAEATSLPLMRWPSLFWQLLLAQPMLRAYADSPSRDVLAKLSAGPRAALLLRLVAGLDRTHGAEVLRVSPEAYRHALYRALQALHAHGIDEVRIRALREQLQARTKLKHDPEAVLHPSRVRAIARHNAERARRAPRWLRPMLIALLAMQVIALAATFFPQPVFWKIGPESTHRFETLRTQAPTATLSATATALAGADFELLDDPDGERMARNLDLYAWYAAGPTAVAPNPNAPASLPESTVPETSAPDTDVQGCANAASAGCAGAAEVDPTEGGGGR
jgi:DNA-directed RNA polymerase specialized sigma24 family protein